MALKRSVTADGVIGTLALLDPFILLAPLGCGNDRARAAHAKTKGAGGVGRVVRVVRRRILAERGDGGEECGLCLLRPIAARALWTGDCLLGCG
jgi:hypothetical protein